MLGEILIYGVCGVVGLVAIMVFMFSLPTLWDEFLDLAALIGTVLVVGLVCGVVHIA